jgi:hypothetical protein
VRPFVGGAATEAPSWAQQAEEYFNNNMKHRATRLAKAGLFPPLFGQVCAVRGEERRGEKRRGEERREERKAELPPPHTTTPLTSQTWNFR